MSTNTMLPALAHLQSPSTGVVLPAQPGPGLSSSAIDSLRSRFPGTLTAEHEQLLRQSCGIDGTALGYLDFTGQWHDEEPLAVFRPCVTLALDSQGRRWIAETTKAQGLPGPVWCVVQDPQVIVYVSDDLGAFLDLLHRQKDAESSTGGLHAIEAAAHRVWTHRGALAFQSRQNGRHDHDVRAWLLQLPRDARVYDLRAPTLGAGWPYGVAGGAGRLHRCGKELLFAVSGFPAPTRWADYLGQLAQRHEAPLPAIVTLERARGAGPPVCPSSSHCAEVRACA